jgi:hypothetical protein
VGAVPSARKTRAGGRSAAILPFPRGGLSVDPLSLLPSRRSLAVGAALLLAGAAAYVFARESSVFAVQRVRVEGAPPAVAAHVRRALRPLQGGSLVSLDASEVERRLAALPDVVSATADRAFPSTLRVLVRPERPVAVLRQGSHWWLASARARVLHGLAPHARGDLPRVWLPATANVSVGATLPDSDGGLAVRALSPLGRDRFTRRVRFVQASGSDVTFVLRSSIQILLGDPTKLPLKLAIARRILPADDAVRYVDVSVPDRPVAGTANPQVESRGLGLAEGDGAPRPLTGDSAGRTLRRTEGIRAPTLQ